MGREIWGERVWMTVDLDPDAQEGSATITRRYMFTRNLGAIAASVQVDYDGAPPSLSQETISEPHKDEIIEDLVEGPMFWLGLDGPKGDFASRVDFLLTAPDELSVDDVELLRQILAELKVRPPMPPAP
jgi:hypothetical protein